MRITLLFLATFLFFGTINAQAPTNDDCTDAIDLGSTPYCDTSMVFDNFEATASDIGDNNIPDCFKGGSSDNDVWFTFTTTDAEQYNFLVEGIKDTTSSDSNALFTPELALYTGSCDTNQLVDAFCRSAENGSNSLSFSTGQLDQNTTYFMRINSAGRAGLNNGNFRLCITENTDSLRLDDVLSVLCDGTISDTGGPNGDYGNNEDYIFTICPEDVPTCLILDMGEYLMEYKAGGGGDYFIVYDGADTTGPILGSSRDIRDTLFKSPHNGIDNSVCQKYMTSSGCLTILWHTDSSVVADGFVASWICSMDSCKVYDTLSVNVAPTDDEIIGAIQGRLLTIDAIDRMCADTAHGVFDGEDTDFGIPRGLLLTTGRADSVARANMVPNFGWNNDTVGIPLLDSLAASYGDTTTTHDGCAIELDFMPDTDVMALEFSLGSEEYTECLVDQLTDILGLFYTTMGYQGNPQLNNYDNIARFVDGQMNSNDIQIDLISPFDTSFYIYYSNNLYSPSLEYDGILSNGGRDNAQADKFVLLTQNVEPCQSNLLMAAIADRGDSLYDSGIFLSNMRCLTPSIQFVSSLGFNFFIETCNPAADSLIFQFPRMYDMDTEWIIRFEGAAEVGSDFTWTHGGTITLPAGQSRVAYDIDVVDDGIEEGSETFKVKLFRDWGCGEVELTELDVSIRDRLIAEISGPSSACKGDQITFRANGDVDLLNMSWEPASLFPDPRLNAVSFTADDDITLFLTGTLNHQFGSCSWGDSMDLIVVDPMVELMPLDSVGICVDESVRISYTQNGDAANRQWFTTGNLNDLDQNPVVFSANQRGLYTVTVTVDSLGCSDRDSVSIIVDEIDYLQLITDTTVCLGESVNLVQSGGSPRTNYSWSPVGSLDNPFSATPIATPDRNTTYTVNYESENGHCTDSEQVTVEVLQVGNVQISNPGIFCRGDTLGVAEIGLPDSIKNNFNVTYRWTFTNGANTILNGAGTDSLTFRAGGGGFLILDAEVQGCIRTDSLRLSVSVPGDGEIMLDPDSLIVDCADVTASINFTGGNAAPDLSTVLWRFDPDEDRGNGNEIEIGENSLTINYNTSQSGWFLLSFLDENGCLHEKSRFIEVTTPENILIPNAFTPNGDTRNDIFRVIFDEGLEYEIERITIYNRWGDLVFEGNDNTGWDGRVDGEEAISEVYLYIIEMRDACGQLITQDILDNIPGAQGTLQGDVTLIR